MIAKYLPKPADDVKVLLCGPPPMISAMKKATEALGFVKARPASKLEDQVFTF
jgi:cytochrome-b5 reductase